jgi:hypothetical protein
MTTSTPSSALSLLPTPTNLPVVHHMVTIKLNRDNYLLWKAQIVPYLRGQHLFGFLDNSRPAPPPTINITTDEISKIQPNPEFQMWVIQDQMILSALISSLSENILAYVVQCTTSREVWLTLERMFTAHSRARVMNIHYQLSTLKKGDSSIADYFHKFTGLIATLAAINKPLTDEEQISFLLAGLGSEFESFVTTVQMRTDLLSIEALYGHLLSHEIRMAQAQPKVDLTLAGAHFASRGISSSRGNRGGRSSNTSHSGRNSSSSGQRTNRGRGRGRGSFTNGSRPTCQVCGKFGHMALNCYHRFDNSYTSDSNMQALLATPQPPVEENWYADSGATHHLTADLANLNVRADEYLGQEQIRVGNGKGLPINHVGTTQLLSPNSSFKLHDVLHVPQISQNLLSVQKFTTDTHTFVELHPNFFNVKDQATGKLLLHGPSRHGLYPFPFRINKSYTSNKNLRSPTAFVGERVSPNQWHLRLGHPALRTVSRIISRFGLPVIPTSNKNSNENFCFACLSSKSKQLSFSPSPSQYHCPLDLIFTDVWGPSPICSQHGFKYYVSFLDASSRYTWLYPMTKKSDAFNIFLQFQKYVERFFNSKIKSVQSDWGGEYRSISTFFQKCGIVHRVSCPHTHQQQGSIERKHRHIVETGLSLLSHAHMPLRYWDDAFQTACYLINRLPTPIIQNKSPFEKLFHSAPDYLFLKTFGCACWPNLRPYNSHKLQPRSLQCVFLGYSLLHRGYKCLHIPTGRLYISRDVIFLENLFPFSQKNSSPSSTFSDQSISLLGPSPLVSLQARSLTNNSAPAPINIRAYPITSQARDPTPATLNDPTQQIPHGPPQTQPHEPLNNTQTEPTTSTQTEPITSLQTEPTAPDISQLIFSNQQQSLNFQKIPKPLQPSLHLIP